MTTSTPPVLHGIDKALEVHNALREQLCSVGAAIDALEGTTPRLIAPWRHFHRGMVEHMEQEETLVFPAVRALAMGTAPPSGFEAPLLEMQYEIDEVRILADALRNAAPDAGPVEAELLALLDALEEHAHMEEQRLFPAAVSLLEHWEQGLDVHLEPVEETALPPQSAVSLSTLLSERRGRAVEVLRLAESSLEVLHAWAEGIQARGAVSVVLIEGDELADASKAHHVARAGVDEVLVVLGDDDDERVKDSIEAIGKVDLPCSVLLTIGDGESARLVGWYRRLLQPHFEHVRECFIHGAHGQSPVEIVNAMSAAIPEVEKADVERFTALLGTLREAFRSERALDGYRYVVSRSHYGTSEPAGRWLDLEGLGQACQSYRQRAARHPELARARLLVELARSMGRNQVRVVMDLVRLQLQYTAGERRTPLAGKYLYLVIG